LPFRSASFEVVTISYGLRNLADFELGLREMHRVLKPGGRLLVLDFGKPGHRVLRTAYFTYLRWFVPILGLVFCRNKAAYGYILESLQHYPAQEGVAAYMRELDCEDVAVFNLLGGTMSINFARKRDQGP
jgi:demethylmenaquinone methyltransferase/2-methoxy-6-polyprenyl-1,4-benzoquinol methylase